jgi:hypothetical protein
MGTLNGTKSASGTLGRVATLGGEQPGALVPDRILWEAAQLDYDEYVEAAAELVGRGS